MERNAFHQYLHKPTKIWQAVKLVNFQKMLISIVVTTDKRNNTRKEKSETEKVELHTWRNLILDKLNAI